MSVIDREDGQPGAVADTPQPSSPTLVPLLCSVAKRTRSLTDVTLRANKLFVGQDELFLALGDRRRLSVQAAAEALAVRPATISKMVDRLVEKGLIARSVDTTDARRVMIGLTTAGTKVRARVAAVRAKLAAELVRELGEEAETVAKTLDRLDEVLTARLRRLR